MVRACGIACCGVIYACECDRELVLERVHSHQQT